MHDGTQGHLMNDIEKPLTRGREFRRQAEALASRMAVPPQESAGATSPADLQRTLHELRVHQIELELQNEELRRTQVELDGTRERFADLYDFAPIGYCTLDGQGMILEANLTAATLLGVDRSLLAGQTLNRFIVKADADSYHLHRKRLLESGEPQALDLRLVKPDGTLFWAHLEAAVETGTPGLRLMLSDVTARKETEAALAVLSEAMAVKNAELELARATAEKANVAKSKFLSSMSHELRSPLNAILGFAQLMKTSNPLPTDSQQASLRQILQAGWYLLALINEILDLAGIESGKVSLSVEPVSLAEILQECQTMVEQNGHKLALKLVFPSFDPAHFILADRIRLKQILLNLLSNAIKYNQMGGTVTVACTRTGLDRTRISVADTGPGLLPEKLAQLFQHFNRLGQENSGVEGTGLGLVVSKLLVELMGGVIGVASTVGVGTVFWFELASAAAPGLTDEPIPPAVAQASAAPGAPLRTVLYVEDNTANLELVRQMIARRPDLRLLSALTGNQGVETARESLPDVILMDINLPDISGLEALRILRNDPATAHIPVLALSANAMPDDIKAGRSAGFFSYLTKPIKLNEVMEAIAVALAKVNP